VSQPGTITGSIGVVAGKMVTTGLYDWVGLNRETLGVGQNATYYYDGARYTPEQKEIYWKFMRKVYDQFTGLVAQGRGMERDAVDRIGQGHVWTGRRAKDLGLVDELGGMKKAIELAKKEAGIPEDEPVRLVYLPEKRSLFQTLLWPEEDTSAVTRMPRELTDITRELSRAALLSREPVWLMSATPTLP
jgi:protease-4